MPDFRKYLNHAKKKKKETREIVEVYKRRPIIKSVIPYETMDDHITFQIPIQSRHFAYNSQWNKNRTIYYQSCHSIEESHKYIDHLPEIMRKARLRKKISKLKEKIKMMVKKQIKGHSNYRHLEFGFTQMAEYPRENVMGAEYNSDGKFLRNFVSQYGRSFNLSSDEQKTVIKVLFDTEKTTAEEIRETYENLGVFIDDIQDSRESMKWSFNNYIDAFIKDIPKYITFLIKAEECVIEIEDYTEKHGRDSRESVSIPKGFKLMDVGYYCWPGWSCNDDILAVQSEDETIEILVFLGDGLGDYSGEVQYKIDKETSSYYSIGSRGIDSAFYTNPNKPETVEEIIIAQGNEARKRQERIKRSVDVQLGSRSWKVTPENVEEIKKLLRDGKSRTFLPSGMGIGVIIANSQGNLPYNLSKYYAGESAEKLFGMPVYAQDIEYD